MTACTNHGGKARRVVTAALVGVLSVGTVPMVALATGTADDGINLQSVQPASTLAEADNGYGDEVTITSGKTVKLEAGKGYYLRPVTLLDSEGNEVDLSEYVITYLDEDKNPIKTASGNPVTDVEGWFKNQASRTAEGTVYYLQIVKGTQDILTVKFTYTTDTAAGVYAYEGTDKNDTTFVYTGDVLDIRFADENGNPVSGSIRWFKTNSELVRGGITDAGDYVAEIKVGTKTYNVPVSVSKLNLSDTSVYLGDQDAVVANRDNFLNKVSVSGYKGTATDDFEVTAVKGPNGGQTLNGESGLYTVTFAAKGGANNTNIEGSATVSFYVLDTNIVTAVGTNVLYGTQNTSAGIGISLADGESFDASKIKVVTSDGTTYKGDQLELSFADPDGKAIDASEISKPSTRPYTVNVRVKAFQGADDEWIGGSKQFNVTVSATKVDANKGLTFTYDGKVVADNGSTSGLTVAYTGEDVLPLIGTEVVDSDGNVYQAGVDYTVKVTEGTDEVDGIVGVGNYVVTVTPVTFEMQGTNAADWQLHVDVVEANFGDLKDLVKKYEDVAYTGAELSVPAVYYQELNDNNVLDPVVDKNNNPVYAELSSDLYKVTKIEYSKNGANGWSTVKTVKDQGTYRVTIKLTDEAEKNYDLSDKVFEFTVSEYGHFADVAPEAWYAVVVDKAESLDYVNGIAGTNLFAPETDITRADVACILFNMAGGTSAHGDEEFQFTENWGYVTGFDDVDGHAYYAQAIAWAHNAGVVNGYEGNFRPTDKVTREEFAAMLANFAKSKGDFEAPSADALAGMPDASGVSAWATESVAWAVENGVMGNGGYVKAQDNIIRAEVAAMAVNYQPVALPKA